MLVDPARRSEYNSLPGFRGMQSKAAPTMTMTEKPTGIVKLMLAGWLGHLPRTVWRTSGQLCEGRLMDRMREFTVLRGLAMGGHGLEKGRCSRRGYWTRLKELVPRNHRRPRSYCQRWHHLAIGSWESRWCSIRSGVEESGLHEPVICTKTCTNRARLALGRRSVGARPAS